MEKDGANGSKEETAKKEKRQAYGRRNAYIAAIAVAIIAAAAFAFYILDVPTVVAGDTVSVYYTGSFTNGTVFSTNVGGTPFNFTVGANQVISGFQNAVIGMKVGESKTVEIPPSEGYGYVNQSRIIVVPISVFRNNTPKVGEVITTITGSQGEIEAINATNATINFNSPLAGKTLVFNIKVLSIKKQ
ncbi:MAG: FKBP-type peptidyl-prolyl cis-trans isomerase [Candidatus Micrarchaeia archaeon]